MRRIGPGAPRRELVAMAVFEPNGAAYLDVSTPAFEATFSRDEVIELKSKIAAFERTCTFEDGRPTERLRRHREAL